MSSTEPTGRSTQKGRALPTGRTAHTRHRRRGWIATIAVVVALTGTVIGLRLANDTTPASSPALPAVGQAAPDGTLTTVDGTTMTVASLRGRPTLLWFVATWCPSCQAGAPILAQQAPRLRTDNVRVVEIELYQNLGQPGPSIAEFAKATAGAVYGDRDWTFGASSADLTRAYVPDGYTDIYYLLDSAGRVSYVNGEPAGTMPDLLAHLAVVTRDVVDGGVSA